LNDNRSDHKKHKGVIVAHYGVAVEVFFAATEQRSMVRVKRNSGHVVGDMVEVEDDVLYRLDRTSELSRMDTRGGIHLVGANLDVLCIIVSCEPLPPPGFIDRAIIASRAAGLNPVVIINKSDLPCFTGYEETIQKTFSNSVTIISVSAVSGAGLSLLKKFFSKGHRGVFVGPTGVGKSSILNRMLPELSLSTGKISETKKRGRHTTTVSTLHMLEDGGELVDSPGFNDFGLVDTTIPELSIFFPGFEEALKTPCRFRDCKHHREPACSVARLVKQGQIPEQRYQAYLQMLSEVEMIETEPKYRERRNRRKKN
jgi:ribosome biogenesis GTPase